jgi:ureidoglycolate amidohydrolase
MNIEIDSDRLTDELETLAHFSATPAPAVTRIVFSQPDLQARAWFKELCTGAGLVVREDAVGNTFARWVGSDASLPAVGTGSHIDAIPHSGRFDGTVGVLGGLEAIRALQGANLRPRRSIELLLFTSEEPRVSESDASVAAYFQVAWMIRRLEKSWSTGKAVR